MAAIETRRRKDGSTSYRVRISLQGHPRVSETFRRKTDAKRWAQSTEAAIRERRYFPGSEAERRTVGELFDRFVAEKLPLRPEYCRGTPPIRYGESNEASIPRSHFPSRPPAGCLSLPAAGSRR